MCSRRTPGAEGGAGSLGGRPRRGGARSRQLAQPPGGPPPAAPRACPAPRSCSLRPSLPSVGGAEEGLGMPDGPVMDQARRWDQPLLQPADLPASERVNPCIQQPDLSATGISVHPLTFLLWLSATPQGGLRWDPWELKVGPHSCAGFPILRTSGKPRADHIFLPAGGSARTLREQQGVRCPRKGQGHEATGGEPAAECQTGRGEGAEGGGVRKLQDGGFA